MKTIITIFISILSSFGSYALLAGMISLLFGLNFNTVTTHPVFIIVVIFSIIPLVCCIGEEVHNKLEKYGL
jgi:hypothetical protein